MRRTRKTQHGCASCHLTLNGHRNGQHERDDLFRRAGADDCTKKGVSEFTGNDESRHRAGGELTLALVVLARGGEVPERRNGMALDLFMLIEREL